MINDSCTHFIPGITQPAITRHHDDSDGRSGSIQRHRNRKSGGDAAATSGCCTCRAHLNGYLLVAEKEAQAACSGTAANGKYLLSL